MPPHRASKRRSFLGQCLRDSADVAGWGLLWTLLAAAACLQAWMLAAGQLRLPDSLRERLQTRLAGHGLRADYSEILFDPSGRFFAKDLRLYQNDSPDPVASARTALLRLDPWALLTARVRVTSLEGSGVNVYLPAYLSPSGRAEPVIAEAQCRVRFDADGKPARVEALSGRAAGFPVALDGELPLPAILAGKGKPATPKTGPTSPLDLTPLYQNARQWLLVGDALRSLGALSVRGQFDDGHISLRADAASLEFSHAPATATGPVVHVGAKTFTLSSSLPLAPEAQAFSRLELHASAAELRVSVPDRPELTGTKVRLWLHDFDALDWRESVPLRLEAAASALEFDAIRMTDIALATQSENIGLPNRARLSACFDGQTWDARARVDGARVALDVEGRPTNALVEIADKFTETKVPPSQLLKFDGAAPRLRIHADLGLDARVRAISGDIEGGDILADTVRVRAASGRFQWRPGGPLLVDDILLRIGASEARGSYRMDPDTLDYRFLLEGHLEPSDIAPWFEDWWSDFWESFAFTAPPEADVEINGRWRAPLETSVFVAARAGGASSSVRGQALADLATLVFVRPGWHDVLRFSARDAAGGEAAGRFTIVTDHEKDEWKSLDFDVVSRLPADALGRLLGPEAVEILAPYHFDRAPLMAAAGRMTFPEKKDFTFKVETNAPMLAGGLRIDALALAGRVQDDVISLDPVSADFAGGRVTGRAVLSGPDDARWVAVDGRLARAQLNEVMDRLDAMNPDDGKKNADEATHRPGGRIDLTLEASGPVAHLEQLSGIGHVSLTEVHLAQIRLFGGLSSLLKATGLGFTSFTLAQLEGDYRLADGQVSFSSLRLQGPSAVVDANGRYDFRSHELDFRAKLFPYEGSKNLLANAADLVLSPLSRALEFQLTGPLDSPNWRFTYGPTNWLKSLLPTGSGKKTDSD